MGATKTIPGRKPGSKKGGRRTGSRNLATIERDIVAKQAAAAIEIMPNGRIVLAKDCMARAMAWFLDRAEEAAGEFLGMPKPSRKDSEAWRMWDDARRRADLYMNQMGVHAKNLAPYQSPQLAMTVVQQVDPLSTMSDEDLLVEMRRYAEQLGLPPPSA